VDIHQASVQYIVNADRLLLRVRTRSDQLFQAWLTRRMMQRLWPALGGIVTKLHLPAASSNAHVMPEAKAMVAEVAREQALKSADFKTPFAPAVREQPLGEEPLLVSEAQLTPLPNRHVKLVLMDEHKRHLTLQMSAGLMTGVQQLMAQALRQSEWGLLLEEAPAAPAPGDPAQPPRLLN
jgi:hypothetical protein